jgi:hypothetical protein
VKKLGKTSQRVLTDVENALNDIPQTYGDIERSSRHNLTTVIPAIYWLQCNGKAASVELVKRGKRLTEWVRGSEYGN